MLVGARILHTRVFPLSLQILGRRLNPGVARRVIESDCKGHFTANHHGNETLDECVDLSKKFGLSCFPEFLS